MIRCFPDSQRCRSLGEWLASGGRKPSPIPARRHFVEQLTDQPPEDTSWQALPELAADFSRSVEEASSRLVSAAEQLTSMTTKFLETGSRLDQAVDSHHEIEAASRRSAEAAAAAAAEASAAVERARAAQDAAEGFQQRVENDYGEMPHLSATSKSGSLPFPSSPGPCRPTSRLR